MTGPPARPVPERIVIATGNAHKVREIREICADWPVGWVTREDVEWPEVEETGSSYEENALLKGRAVAEATGLPALADDSGIEVDALGGAPGHRSARYAGATATDQENLDALLRAIAGVPGAGRTARYRAVAVLAWPEGEVLSAEGVCEGVLRTEPAGEGGFGYDPIFEPAGWDRTMAELSPQEKHRISHRGRALRELFASLGGR